MTFLNNAGEDLSMSRHFSYMLWRHCWIVPNGGCFHYKISSIGRSTDSWESLTTIHRTHFLAQDMLDRDSYISEMKAKKEEKVPVLLSSSLI